MPSFLIQINHEPADAPVAIKERDGSSQTDSGSDAILTSGSVLSGLFIYISGGSSIWKSW